jgi:adenylosuccinate lyase
MPHKINPIDFENCEGKYLILLKNFKGNLGLSNALIIHFN